MIHNVSGDILHTKAQLIAHSIAANDPMNQGLAMSLHQKFPAMHKDFHHWCHQNHPKPGAVWLWSGVGGVRIANLIIQEGGHEHGSKPGKGSIKSVRDSLKALVKIIEKENIASLALPKIATGVGGLNWDDVSPVVEERLSGLDIPVYLYTEYRPDVKAEEP